MSAPPPPPPGKSMPGGDGGGSTTTTSSPFSQYAGPRVTNTPSADPAPSFNTKQNTNFQRDSFKESLPLKTDSGELFPRRENTNDGQSIDKALDQLSDVANSLDEIKQMRDEIAKLRERTEQSKNKLAEITKKAQDRSQGDGGDNQKSQLSDEEKQKLADEYRKNGCKDCPPGKDQKDAVDPNESLPPVPNAQEKEDTADDTQGGDQSFNDLPPAWTETFFHTLEQGDSFGLVFDSKSGIHMGNAMLLSAVQMYNDPSKFAPGESHTFGSIKFTKWKYGKTCVTYTPVAGGGPLGDSNAMQGYNLLRDIREGTEKMLSIELNIKNRMKHLNDQISSLGIGLAYTIGESAAKDAFGFGDSAFLSYEQNGHGAFGMENIGSNMLDNLENMVYGVGAAANKLWENLVDAKDFVADAVR